MAYETLISTQDLSGHLRDLEWVIVDCRFSLANPEAGRSQYLESHIPQAVYAHLDEDLSGPVIPGVTGRHPLPEAEFVVARFGELGIGSHTQVIAYDGAGGALAAARLWWILRWLGHESAAVLDGGWQKWVHESRPIRWGEEKNSAQKFSGVPNSRLVADSDEVELIRQDRNYHLVDVRLPPRYLGEIEPIDRVAGHIPGAINIPYDGNLTSDGIFLPKEELLKQYRPLLEGVPIENIVFYCGSGVTSIHSILAIMVAGLGEARLYPGSWSEWITDPKRPVTTSGQDQVFR